MFKLNLFKKPLQTEEERMAERTAKRRASAERAQASRAERVERIMQKLRKAKPGWSDEKLRAFAAATFGAEQRARDANAQQQSECDALVADGNRLLVQCEATADRVRELLTRPALERPTVRVRTNGGTVLMTVDAFMAMQGDLAQRVIGGGDDNDRERLAEANSVAREYGLPEVYRQ